MVHRVKRVTRGRGFRALFVGEWRRDAEDTVKRHPGGMTPPIVVHPPERTGGRRVTAHAQVLGTAHSERDVVTFLRRVGLTPEEIDLRDGNLVEWRGGGPETWS
jgi:hypothetical protein